ncbi:Oidioi.mRNA.OKI2018_I69.PAR.g12320.t1.cds [Oikopleura dioica]|uniref:Oidioi.mRNA.OKI2018_I69.PAR.g12320.t1.cds n=1 Tax=Oikopleura dioica TaxID=34765 RepID=A0ABN7RZG7_OIKDI|nr:Oidioi.mRNA.OKI2018_I69.PAR.g12320.t1.cds [Oikopleura dioica]
MSAAQKELLKISQDKDAYKSMLEKLIVQSSFQLLEDKVYVICRECDKSTVEGLLDNVEAAYKGATGKSLSISVHPSKSLPKDCAGGINLCNINESITISNTLEARLDMLAKAGLPQMRETLFGSNPNRKFRD